MKVEYTLIIGPQLLQKLLRVVAKRKTQQIAASLALFKLSKPGYAGFGRVTKSVPHVDPMLTPFRLSFFFAMDAAESSGGLGLLRCP